MSGAKYEKGEGTSGIRGQLYESKLLSLIFYRAKHDDSIEEFQLASNIADIGAFDDICFKVKVKGFAKPLIVAIQAKHKDNSEQTLDIDMMKYFYSYLKIRQKFELCNKDDIFQGKYQETESFFVLYTSGKDTFGNESVESDSASKLNYLIDTGGTAKQPYKHATDVKFLCEIFMKDQIISLAKQLATFIIGERNFQMMLTDELMLTYHVVLALRVVEISDIEPDGHRIATFRQDFFDSKEECLNLFKNTLFKEILERRKIEPYDIKKILSEFLAEPTDVLKLSKLIGTFITYENGRLELVKTATKDFNEQLNQVDISRSTVNKAIDVAAREMLSKGLKVPAAFGNKDLMLSGSNAKKARRIKHLTSKFIDLLDKCKSSNIITIDNSLDSGFLQLNGGIAGAIGNIFVLDDNTKLMKITDNWQLLGDLAQVLYKNVTDTIQNLHEIRFSFNVGKFPKLSFDCSEYEETLAKDFLNKLLFYSKQANEKGVEQILKDKIEEYQLDHPNYFQAKTDAMFLKYHDNIQNWWMQSEQASYLTKDSNIFENAINHIIKDPLLSSINIICMNKINQVIDYTFTEDFVSSWNLLEHSSIIITTENSALTVVKLLQLLKNKDHVVINLEYIGNLPTNDRNVLRTELKNINDLKVIIFVCDIIQNTRDEIKTLENIAKVILFKKIIIITNSVSVVTLQKYFPSADGPVHDVNSLTHMSLESQKSILETTRVMFQGVEVRLDLIVDDKSKAYVKGDILNKIIDNDIIRVGKLNVTRNYDEIKHLYFDRGLQKTGPTINKPIEKSPFLLKTFYDIEDDIVLVTAEPGMGKSTLLTHLSLNTKKDHPEAWIVRINLLEYSRELNKWKEGKTAVDTLETLKFMCQVILREKHGKVNNVAIALEEQNGVVYLKDCTGDQCTEFELKLFLHFFNDGKVIFLFDGFDEICPHYINEAIKCIEIVNDHCKKHKIWVTSRSYAEIKTILQRAFGFPFEIKHMSLEEKYQYLKKIWQSNLILKELDKIQLENVHGFLEFMSISKDRILLPFEWPLYEIYMSARFYLENEIEGRCQSLQILDEFDRFQHSILENVGIKLTKYRYNSNQTPLNLFLRAYSFINNIKYVSKNSNKWNQDVKTFTFYQQYLETTLKKIRFEDKNKMDIYNPDVRIAYEKELADCIVKHKKLAAYAIFNQDIDQFFTKKDLEEIKDTIKCIEKGREKTGLVASVANDVPIFIHMTFAEYFAVEYICDLLKNDSENLILRFKFMFNVMFPEYNFTGVQTIFDCKMKIDKTLMSIIENNKEGLYNLLMEQGKECLKKGIEHKWLPVLVLWEKKLPNLISLFASIFEKCINDSNIEEFLEMVDSTCLFKVPNLVSGIGDELIVCIFDIIRKFDITKLRYLLRHLGLYYRSFDRMCGKEILELIHTSKKVRDHMQKTIINRSTKFYYNNNNDNILCVNHDNLKKWIESRERRKNKKKL